MCPQQPWTLTSLWKAASRALGGTFQDHLAKEQDAFLEMPETVWQPLQEVAKGSDIPKDSEKKINGVYTYDLSLNIHNIILYTLLLPR